MDIFYLLRGLVLGFAIAAPVGPIGVLCIRRTLADGRLVGFVTGLGAATADATYGAIAAFGISAVSAVLIGLRLWIHLLGALFLAWLGLRTTAQPPSGEARRRRARERATADGLGDHRGTHPDESRDDYLLRGSLCRAGADRHGLSSRRA